MPRQPNPAPRATQLRGFTWLSEVSTSNPRCRKNSARSTTSPLPPSGLPILVAKETAPQASSSASRPHAKFLGEYQDWSCRCLVTMETRPRPAQAYLRTLKLSSCLQVITYPRLPKRHPVSHEGPASWSPRLPRGPVPPQLPRRISCPT